MPYQSYSIRTRSEMSAPKAKRRQEVAVSDCSRPGRSRQEVCDCRESPAPAKTETLLVMLAVFFFGFKTSTSQKEAGLEAESAPIRWEPTNFFFKNLGSVHYPKGLQNPFGRSLVTLDFAQRKQKIKSRRIL